MEASSTQANAPETTTQTSAVVFPPSTVIVDFLRIHPGLVGTFFYLLLTTVGVIYDVLFYGLFHIPILNYSELGDFLLAGFQQPILFLFVVASVLILRRLIHRDQVARARSERYRRLAERMESNPYFSAWFLYPLIVLIYFFAITMLFARYRANLFLQGAGQAVEVELITTTSETALALRQHTQLLLGTNNKFLFLYSPLENRTRVVPLSSIIAVGVAREAVVRDTVVGKPVGTDAVPSAAATAPPHPKPSATPTAKPHYPAKQ